MVNVLLGALVTGETVRILLSFEAFHSGAHLSSTLLACWYVRGSHPRPIGSPCSVLQPR